MELNENTIIEGECVDVLSRLPDNSVDLIFADPPYNAGMGPRAVQSAIMGGWLAPDALVVVEEGSEITLPGIAVQEVRRYGDTVIHIGTVLAN